MIKLAYNKSEPNLVFEIEEICRVPMNGGIVEYYKGVLTDTSTIPDTHIENYMVQVMAFESDWAEVPTDVGGTSNVNNTSITVDPETSKKTYGTPSGYTGINNVTVNAVTSAIDSNIAAGNIKDGVTILGVAGTYVKPDEPNLVAGNIKKDVTIYGVTGTVEEGADLSDYFVLNPTLQGNSSDLKNLIKGLPDSMVLSGTTMANLCSGCTNLVSVPQFNTSNITSMYQAFKGCTSLSNESLNNILAMCAGVSASYSSTKTLYDVFNADMSATYSASTIQGLSNYAAFTAAGWTIGWS